ncbi:MAG: helix-turn-helix transcriptional regulator [Lentisphaerae bacterium]|nr:helix-turn-helix transcriptional regulator [Lentisphaerota bacterium]
MDKPCDFIDKIAEWVSARSQPPLFFAELARRRSLNTPAPYVALGFMAKGDLGEWVVGGKPWTLPLHHLYIGCCHQGSASSDPAESVEFWGAALDMAGVPEFDYLWKHPVREMTRVSDPARLTEAFQKLASRLLVKDEADPLFLKASILELFAVVRSEFSQSGTAACRPATIERALDWMTHHFHEPDLTLDDVARISGLSVHHFGRTFRECMGESVMRYLRNLRIRHGCTLLQGTAMRVNEVAFAVGFRDALHFSRVFHARTGRSPRAFRRGD